MPKGTPSAEQLMSHKIGISIDTNVFQSLGFQFEMGELAVLHQQLPPWISLHVPSVVWRETLAHQLDNARDASIRLQSSVRDVKRHTGINVSEIEQAILKLQLNTEPEKLFRARFTKFAQCLNGEIVTLKDSLLTEIFESYFSVKPPFEHSKDKKHEFPDAASLLALEDRAKELSKKLVIVSNDKGWEDFADNSEHLYCVKSLAELTALYVADSVLADEIEKRIIAQFDGASVLQKKIEEALEEEISMLVWVAEADAPAHISSVDPEIVDATYQYFNAVTDTIRLWMSGDDHKICVFEIDLQVMCNFEVSAEFFSWDSIDKEHIPVGFGSKVIEKEIPVSAFVTISGDLKTGDPGTWKIDVQFSQTEYAVDVGPMSPESYEE